MVAFSTIAASRVLFWLNAIFSVICNQMICNQKHANQYNFASSPSYLCTSVIPGACSRKISAGKEDFFQASCIVSKVPVLSPSGEAYNWPMRAGSHGDECVPANNSSRQNSWGFIIM